MYSGRYIASEISSKYVIYTKHYHLAASSNNEEILSYEYQLKHIDSGLRLGSFLFDAGWLQDSIKVLSIVCNVIDLLDMDYSSIIIKLDCLQRWVDKRLLPFIDLLLFNQRIIILIVSSSFHVSISAVCLCTGCSIRRSLSAVSKKPIERVHRPIWLFERSATQDCHKIY